MIGLSLSPVSVALAQQITTSLAAPENLFTLDQASLLESAHVDLRSNWQISGGALSQIGNNGSTNDARLQFDMPLIPGHAHVALWSHEAGSTQGRYKPGLAGDGLEQGHTRYADDTKPMIHYVSAGAVNGFTRLIFNPLDDIMDAALSEFAVYDLSSTDPSVVACDVILCLGDSNMGNAVSDFVTSDNLETAFDPRIWYMPCLRLGGSFGPSDSQRHIPQPCMEPVQGSGGAKRMSPVMACAGEIVGWSAARGRPLLMLSLGDPGTGLNGTEDWDKSSSVPGTGSLMYNEMLAMVNALNALGPQHQIIGAVVSLGANDTTAADYASVWEHKAAAFITHIRTDLALPNLPAVWITPGEHYDPVPGETRGSRMITAIERLDQDSGSPVAISNLKAVRPPLGNQLTDATDPHFTAHGMQANGRAMGQSLLSLL